MFFRIERFGFGTWLSIQVGTKSQLTNGNQHWISRLVSSILQSIAPKSSGLQSSVGTIGLTKIPIPNMIVPDEYLQIQSNVYLGIRSSRLLRNPQYLHVYRPHWAMSWWSAPSSPWSKTSSSPDLSNMYFW